MTENGNYFKVKKDLYILYYELHEMLTQHQIELSKDEFCEKIENVSIGQLSNYIKTLIQLVLKNAKSKRETDITPSDAQNVCNYECLLRHLEKENRNLYQTVF